MRQASSAAVHPLVDGHSRQPEQRCAWAEQALALLRAEEARSCDTNLIRLNLPGHPGISLYLKDESAHPTGSLKHRLARALILYAICNGWVGPDTHLIEASSGSTAVSEAYFARLLGLPFTAVVPASTAAAKLEAIRANGGAIRMVAEAALVRPEAARLAREIGGCFLDQFTHAERATDWRCNNLAERIFQQMAGELHPLPTWIVCGAGTGGTGTMMGRYIRYRGLPTRLCLADPVHSVFHRHHADQSVLQLSGERGSIIEGIGRPSVEASFFPQLIDRAISVADPESIGAMRALSQLLGKKVGGSTGTNLWACMQLIREMAAARQQGSIVTLLCDGGERYLDSYYNDAWLEDRGIDWSAHTAEASALLQG